MIALYLLLCGLVFGSITLVAGEPASLRSFFAVSGWLMLPVAPAVSMRLLSDEFRSGTIESLMTAPVSDASVIAGKYAGAALFLGAMVAPTVLYALILAFISSPGPDGGPIVAGYLSLLLLGLLYLAIGTLASALTANQTLAFLGTFLFLLVLLLCSSELVSRAPAPVARALSAVAIAPRLADFAKGVIDLSHVVFFLSASAWFLVLATIAVQSRRWR